MPLATLQTVNRNGVAILLLELDAINALELADRAYIKARHQVVPAINLADEPSGNRLGPGVALQGV